MSEKIWSEVAWEDYIYWQTQAKKTIKRMTGKSLLHMIGAI